MQLFALHKLVRNTGDLVALTEICECERRLGNGDKQVTNDRIEWLQRRAGECGTVSQVLSLHTSSDHASALVAACAAALHGEALTYNIVKTYCTALYGSMLSEVKRTKFAFVPADEGKMLDSHHEKWKLIHDEFPAVSDDSYAAAAAYAMELYTAAVFHLMRVAELALRMVARKLRVKLRRSIEFEDWQKILTAIDVRRAMLGNRKKTKKVESEIQFYAESALDLKAFKEAWRNHASHAREAYGNEQAWTVYVHVNELWVIRT